MIYYLKNIIILSYNIILIYFSSQRLSCKLKKNVEFKVFQEH